MSSLEVTVYSVESQIYIALHAYPTISHGDM